MHTIYVCIPCDRTIHGERNLGIHCNSHHNMPKEDARNRGIIMDIGDCKPSDSSARWNWKCSSPHDREATDTELQTAMTRRQSELPCFWCRQLLIFDVKKGFVHKDTGKVKAKGGDGLSEHTATPSRRDKNA